MLLLPTEINDLKARVKAECTRRSQTGSVAAYAGTDYDYTTVPATGVLIAAEHYNKIAIPLNAINADIISQTNTKDLLTEESQLTQLDAFLTVLETRDIKDTSSGDCKSSCTGACYGCATTCTGTCKGSCTGSCTGGCSGSCKGSCSGCTSCSGDCTQTCGFFCGQGCSGACYTY